MTRAISIVPATAEDIRWVAELQHTLFGEHAIAAELLLGWHAANPNGFRIVRAGEERIGQIDVLPVREEMLQRFVRGELRERDLRGTDLHPPSERAQVRDLYIESIVVLGEDKREHDAGVAELLRVLAAAILESLGDEHSLRDVYAAGATAAGNRFLQRLGFARTSDGERDDHLVMHRSSYAALRARLRSR